jgi:putative hydroxymethylpyrimidine transport system substrate-binding protein
MRAASILALALTAALALGSPARAADRLVVVLDWLVNPDQAP